MGWMDEMKQMHKEHDRPTPEQILYPIGEILLLALGLTIGIITINCMASSVTVHEINFTAPPQYRHHHQQHQHHQHHQRSAISRHRPTFHRFATATGAKSRLYQSPISTPYIVTSLIPTPGLREISGRWSNNLGIASNFSGGGWCRGVKSRGMFPGKWGGVWGDLGYELQSFGQLRRAS